MAEAALAGWRYADGPCKPGWYLRLVREGLRQTAEGKLVRLGWAGEAFDAAGFRQELRRALDRRINLKVGPAPRWRKLEPEWQTACARDARRVNDYARARAVHPVNRLETPELQRRFGWSYGPDGLDIRLTPRNR